MEGKVYLSPRTSEVHLRSAPSGFISHALKIKLVPEKKLVIMPGSMKSLLTDEARTRHIFYPVRKSKSGRSC